MGGTPRHPATVFRRDGAVAAATPGLLIGKADKDRYDDGAAGFGGVDLRIVPSGVG